MKRCTTCQELKALDAFNLMRRAADGRQPRCRDCCKAWYLANSAGQKAAVAERNRRHRAETHRWLAVYLTHHPCVDCGEDDIRCLEFDHRPGSGKLSDVMTLVRQSASLRKIQGEMAKCDVRCANCHRRRTAERGRHWRQGVYENAEVERGKAAAERLRRLLAVPD